MSPRTTSRSVPLENSTLLTRPLPAPGALSLLLVVLGFIASPVPADDLSPIYDSSIDELTAKGEDREADITIGLLLADRLSAEGSTIDATSLLDELPPTQKIRGSWPAVAAYANAVRCAHGIRRGRLRDHAPLCDLAVTELEEETGALLRSRVQWAQGFRLLQAGRYAEGSQAARLALEEAQRAQSLRAEAWAWELLGQLQSEMGLLSSAVDSFDEAGELAARLRDGSLTDIVADGATGVHLELGNFAEAQDLATRRLRRARDTNQPFESLVAQVQLARAYFGLGEARAALETLAPALGGDRTRHDPATLVRALTVQARSHLELADADAALDLLREGSALATSLDHRPRLYELEIARIEAIAASGGQTEALEEALALREQLRAEDGNELDALLPLLAELAAADGRFELASSALAERKRGLADRRTGAISTRLALLERDYAVQLAERQIEILREERARQQALAQRNTTLLGGITAVLALLATTVWLQRARRRQKLAAAEQAYMAKELEGLIEVRSQALELEVLQREEREAERRELQERLAQSDPTRKRGEATGDFAGVAEELLQAVLSAADELERLPEMPWPQQRERLRVIRSAASSALFLEQEAPLLPTRSPGCSTEVEGLEGLRALLVEDDEEVRRIVERQLISLGLEVSTASDGAQGLEMAESTAPDLVVADVRTPGEVDGVELGTRVRGLRPDLPVLLVSGFEGLGDEVEFPLLAKPFSRAKLQSALEDLLGQKAFAGA